MRPTYVIDTGNRFVYSIKYFMEHAGLELSLGRFFVQALCAPVLWSIVVTLNAAFYLYFNTVVKLSQQWTKMGQIFMWPIVSWSLDQIEIGIHLMGNGPFSKLVQGNICIQNCNFLSKKVKFYPNF